jgi:hypothetical protein
LPFLIEFLVERRRIDPKAALALIGIRAHLNQILLLTTVLDECESTRDKEDAAAFAYRYATLDETRSATWRAFGDLAKKHSIVLAGIDSFIATTEQKELLEVSESRAIEQAD